MAKSTELFDCVKCPAYCCSYAHIHVTKSNIRRLAKHFGVSEEQGRKRFTKSVPGERKRVLRHQMDEHYGSVCRFLDTETRQCTVYKARPKICRDYPGRKRCGYWEFLIHERESQDDPDYIAITNNF